MRQIVVIMFEKGSLYSTKQNKKTKFIFVKCQIYNFLNKDQLNHKQYDQVSFEFFLLLLKIFVNCVILNYISKKKEFQIRKLVLQKCLSMRFIINLIELV